VHALTGCDTTCSFFWNWKENRAKNTKDNIDEFANLNKLCPEDTKEVTSVVHALSVCQHLGSSSSIFSCVRYDLWTIDCFVVRFFWPLYFLSFFDIELLVTSLVSSGYPFGIF
jgi:hypothetical protein